MSSIEHHHGDSHRVGVAREIDERIAAPILGHEHDRVDQIANVDEAELLGCARARRSRAADGRRIDVVPLGIRIGVAAAVDHPVPDPVGGPQTIGRPQNASVHDGGEAAERDDGSRRYRHGETPPHGTSP